MIIVQTFYFTMIHSLTSPLVKFGLVGQMAGKCLMTGHHHNWAVTDNLNVHTIREYTHVYYATTLHHIYLFIYLFYLLFILYFTKP